MKLFVPDASVILKWALGQEDDADEAAALLTGWLHQEHEFVVPALWRYEVGNVLGQKRPAEAQAIFDLLSAYQFEEVSISGEISRITFGLMGKHRGVTFYDACYHAVALAKNGTMVTADRSYFAKVKNEGNILLVGNGRSSLD